MIFCKLKRCLSKFWKGSNYIQRLDTSEMIIDNKAKLNNCRFIISEGSKLIIEQDVKLTNVCFIINKDSVVVIKSESIIEDTGLEITNSSRFEIGRNNTLRNTSFMLDEGVVILGKGNRISSGKNSAKKNYNEVSGLLSIGDGNLLDNTFWVRFGGKITIENCNLINAGTEIRCDESIIIGSHNGISFNCDIWDTNTHFLSTIEERKAFFENTKRLLLENETKKPKTKQVMIGDGNWLGKNACVLKGTKIENNVIVGTRAIVAGASVESDKIVVSPKSVII